MISLSFTAHLQYLGIPRTVFGLPSLTPVPDNDRHYRRLIDRPGVIKLSA